jgi:hypothetical protein
MMRYFFNDVEVTETEYKELISKSLPDVPAKFVQVVPNVKVEPKTKVKPKKSVAKPASSGSSKIDQAIELFNNNHGLTDAQFITLFQLKLGAISKGNASIYLKKVKERTK